MAEPVPEKEIGGAYELPEGWVWAALSEICKPKITKDPKKTGSGWFIYLDIESIDNEIQTIVRPRRLNNKKAPSRAKRLVKSGDVIISLVRPYLKNIALIPEDLDNSIASTAFYPLKPENGIDSDYLFHVICRQSFIDSIVTYGDSPPSARDNEFIQIQIPLPPLAEQRRITAKLEALLAQVNAAKDHLAAVPPIIKRFRQSVLAAACSGRLTEDWRREHPDVEPALELLKRIREERIRRYEKECQKAKAEDRRKPKNPKNIEPQEVETEGLPELLEGWGWTYFNELGELSRGKSKHRPRNDPKLFGGEYPFIQTGDVANSGGVLTKFSQTYNEVGLSQSRLFPEGTVCITIAANIAESSILTFPACFPDSVVGFVPDDILIDGKFFEFYIRIIKDDLSGYAPATAQKNINLKILNRVIVPLPPLLEQRAIVNRIETLFHRTSKVKERVAATTSHADRLTQSILAKAFRGELVPQDPDDEPASVLLERIRKERTELKKKKKPQKRRSKTI